MFLFKFRYHTISFQKIASAAIIFGFLILGRSTAQNLPIGYIRYYSQKANPAQTLQTIHTCTPHLWNSGNTTEGIIMYPLVNDNFSADTFVINMGIIRNMVFGEYIMEFEFSTSLIQNADSSGFCFAGPVKSPDTYYTFIFGNDQVTFYFINKGIAQKIESKNILPLTKTWNTIRVTRNILNRSVAFTLNGDKSQEVVFTHPRLVMGYIGFGTLNSRNSVRNITIWAPTVITDSTFLCK